MIDPYAKAMMKSNSDRLRALGDDEIEDDGMLGVEG